MVVFLASDAGRMASRSTFQITGGRQRPQHRLNGKSDASESPGSRVELPYFRRHVNTSGRVAEELRYKLYRTVESEGKTPLGVRWIEPEGVAPVCMGVHAGALSAVTIMVSRRLSGVSWRWRTRTGTSPSTSI